MNRPANDEMVQGYRDGFDLSAPEPTANRSHSYRHGFANGRDDRRGYPRATFKEINEMAEDAMDADIALNMSEPDAGSWEKIKAKLGL